MIIGHIILNNSQCGLASNRMNLLDSVGCSSSRCLNRLLASGGFIT